MTPKTFFNHVRISNELSEGLATTFHSDVLDNADTLIDNALDFTDLFQDLITTKQGKAFLLALVGYDNLEDYLDYLADTLDISDIEEEE